MGFVDRALSKHLKRSSLRVIALGVSLLAPVCGAVADDNVPPASPPPAASPQEACAPDIKRFCADIDPGQGRVVRCLRDHESQLSPSCKAARTSARARIERKLQKTDPD
jgi:hypothetical protein